MVAYICEGTTRTNEPCKNMTTNPSKWCGRCKEPAKKTFNSKASKTDLQHSSNDIPLSDIEQQLKKSSMLSSIGMASTIESIKNSLSRFKELSLTGGLIVADYKPESSDITSSSYVQHGTWEEDTFLSIKDYEATIEYNAVKASAPYAFPIVNVFSKEEQNLVTPLQMVDSMSDNIEDHTCVSCRMNVKEKTHITMHDSNNYVTVCQTCYVRNTNSKNKKVVEDTFYAIEDANLIFDNDVISSNIEDGNVFRALAVNSVKSDDPYKNFMDHLTSGNENNSVTSYDIAKSEAVFGYANMGLQIEGFLKPEERLILEKLIEPGYSLSKVEEIIMAIQKIDFLDKKVAERMHLEMQAKQGIRNVGSPLGEDIEAYITEDDSTVEYDNIKTLYAVGSDGRKYKMNVSSLHDLLFLASEQDTIFLPANTIVKRIDESDNVIPYHCIDVPSNASSASYGGNCGNGKKHFFFEATSPFPILNENIVHGEKCKICAICQSVFKME